MSTGGVICIRAPAALSPKTNPKPYTQNPKP